MTGESAAIDRLRALAERYATPVMLLPSDLERDSRSTVVEAQRGDALPDRTAQFFDRLRPKMPTRGQVIFFNVPAFGMPGSAKSVTCTSFALAIGEYYGWDKVQVQLSNHLPTLADAMMKNLREHGKPVQILFCDDPLSFYSSRQGGTTELNEAVGLVNVLRHKFEDADKRDLNAHLNGIIYVLFTSQMYKGLEKSFRSGYVIFRSADDSDKSEIKSDTDMDERAWRHLQGLTGDAAKTRRMDESIVKIPGKSAGILRLPMRDDKFLDDVLRIHKLDAHLKDTPERKYKAIMRAWTVQSIHLGPQEKARRIEALMQRLAEAYAEQSEEAVHDTQGQDKLKIWVRAYCADRFDGEGEGRITVSETVELIKVKTIREIAAKVKRVREAAMAKKIRGERDDGRLLSDDEFIDWVATQMISDGYDPALKEGRGTLRSRLWELSGPWGANISARALDLERDIESRIKHRLRGPTSAKGKLGASDATSQPAAPAPRALAPAGGQFMFDYRSKAEEAAALVRGKNPTAHRAYNVWLACKYGVTFDGKPLNSVTMIGDEPHGRAWQQLQFGAVVERPQISRDFGWAQGNMNRDAGRDYEQWVGARLKEGWFLRGIFDRAPIMEVVVAGGDGHEPDVTVYYTDGTKDYVSCKVYRARSLSITVDSQAGGDKETGEGKAKVEIRPEVDALRRDEERGITGNRIVLLVRDTFYDDAQWAVVWNKTVELTATVGFRYEKSQMAAASRRYEWVRPDPKPVEPLRENAGTSVAPDVPRHLPKLDGEENSTSTGA